MFCTNCGAEIADGNKFCKNCGAAVEDKQVTATNVTQTTTHTAQGQWHLSCPRCGNANLQVQSGNRVTSSVSTGRQVGRKSAIVGTSYNNIRETYWFCPNCGMQFRDLDELKSLFTKEKRNSKILGITGIAMLAVIIVMMIIVPKDALILLSPALFLLFIMLVLYAILYFWMSHNAKEHEKQYIDLLPKVRRK